MSGVSEMEPAAGPVVAMQAALQAAPRRWVVTGSAGFIGSHLLEQLLRLGQTVVSVDNFSTGHRSNLDEVRAAVGERAWTRHTFIEGDIVDLATCRRAVQGADAVLHQAALGSVPRSIDDPLASHASNVDGFLNMLVAARDAGVQRFVYAASSATYGDHPGLPKLEDEIGAALSPYAVTKHVNELYAAVFARCYGLRTIGLRYFNVFGARQDPEGPYAAVIPRWVSAMLRGETCQINGDGDTSRDFCYVSNVVEANLLAGTAPESACDTVYNVALGQRTTLNELHQQIAAALQARLPQLRVPSPHYGPFRDGDVRHSLADVGRLRERLRYVPPVQVQQGLHAAMQWYVGRFAPGAAKVQAA